MQCILFLVYYYFIFINSYKLITSLYFITIGLSTFFVYKYLLDTPRWLLTQKKYNELIQVFESIAIINDKKNNFDIFIKDDKDIILNNAEKNY